MGVELSLTDGGTTGTVVLPPSRILFSSGWGGGGGIYSDGENGAGFRSIGARGELPFIGAENCCDNGFSHNRT